ncbi:MAG: riboflavin synthase [Acidobacteria bacterium]|nr:riboflavin synthase [Acidobacteriota bacterium]MCG2815434.1 riboflavin synthase [Candidatus Aminicenantes bacterium]
MFTGIIRHMGRFEAYHNSKRELVISAPEGVVSWPLGESLAVNGVCLSITAADRGQLVFNLSPETLTKTNLGRLRRGDRLNLELPLTLQTPLSGHLVSGHIDGVEKVVQITSGGGGKRFRFTLSAAIGQFVIPKGSVAVNGISLTVAELDRHFFEVDVIPITLKDTNLNDLKHGDPVNVESDMIGKYVYNWAFKKGDL